MIPCGGDPEKTRDKYLQTCTEGLRGPGGVAAHHILQGRRGGAGSRRPGGLQKNEKSTDRAWLAFAVYQPIRVL